MKPHDLRPHWFASIPLPCCCPRFARRPHTAASALRRQLLGAAWRSCQRGEAACQTLLREFIEELDLQIECGHLVCTGENFFEYDGEPHHEIGLYFAVSLPPSCALLDKSRTHVGTEAGRKLEFSWFLTSQLQRIDMRPSVLRVALVSGTLPRHFVQEPGNAT